MLTRLIEWVKKMFNYRSTLSENNLLSEQHKREIETKRRNLQLLYGIVGDNPLKHIDWIIENGFEKFNRWYRSYEDGSIGIAISDSERESSRRKIIKIPSKTVFEYDEQSMGFKEHRAKEMAIGYYHASVEEKEIDKILRDSLSSKDYRVLSNSSNLLKDSKEKFHISLETVQAFHAEFELRGGVGNKVLTSWSSRDESAYEDMFS